MERVIERIEKRKLEKKEIKRIRRKEKKVGIGEKERKRNVDGDLSVKKEKEINIRGRSVMMIDDVYKKGEKVKDEKREIMRGGEKRVDVLKLRRVLNDWRKNNKKNVRGIKDKGFEDYIMGKEWSL